MKTRKIKGNRHLSTEKSPETEASPSSGWKFRLVIVVATMCAVVWFLNRSSTHTGSSHATPLLDVGHIEETMPRLTHRHTETLADRIAAGVRLRRAHQELLRTFVQGDQEGEELARFLRERGTYITLDNHNVAIATDPGAGARGEGVRVGQTFLVVELSLEERIARGLPHDSEWEFSGADNLLYCPPIELFNQMIGAAGLIHELRHAFDLNTGVEPPQAHGDAYLQGERRAYDVEQRLLNRSTNGALQRTIDDLLFQPGSASTNGWKRIDQFSEEQWRSLNDLLGPTRSRAEEGIRGGALIVALNFRWAERQNLGQNGQIAFLREIYGSLAR